MNLKLMPRGTLAKMARDKNLVGDILLLEHKPEGYTDDELTSVRVVTLHEYAHECATRQALLTFDLSDDLNLAGASSEVDKILKEQFSKMKEFIYIDEQSEILIGVDRVTIDDAAVNYGLNMLFDMDCVDPDSYQQFGDWVYLD